MCQPCQNHQPMSNRKQFGSFSGTFSTFPNIRMNIRMAILIFNSDIQLENHNLILGLEWPRNVPTMSKSPINVNGQQFGSFSGTFQLFRISEWISEWPFWYSILIFNLKNHNLILGLEWPRNVPTMSKSPTNVKWEAIWVIFRHFFNFSRKCYKPRLYAKNKMFSYFLVSILKMCGIKRWKFW